MSIQSTLNISVSGLTKPAETSKIQVQTACGQPKPTYTIFDLFLVFEKLRMLEHDILLSCRSQPICGMQNLCKRDVEVGEVPSTKKINILQY